MEHRTDAAINTCENARMNIKRLTTNSLRAVVLALCAIGGSAMATEEPKYTVTVKEGDFEVRDYPAMVAAEVTVSGDRGEASSEGFKLLAGYIFGGNTRKQSIAMTAPVVQSPSESEKIAMTAPVLQTGQSGQWTVRFLMPSSYTLETLPKPNDDRVRLLPVPAARQAVVQFSGLAREGDILAQTALLNTFVASQKLQMLGAPTLARYNPPWTPWFMRRNEIMVAVQP